MNLYFYNQLLYIKPILKAMKKYLMTGVAALALCAGFVGCSKDDDVYDPNADANQVVEKYNAAFIQAFGQPAANQDWGFGSASSSRMMTRANAVVTGDPFTFEETDGYYKNEVPSTANLLSDFVREDWGGQVDENAMQNATELSLPDGEYSIHLWQGQRDIYVSGDVTLNVTDSKSINQARIYLLENATLNLNMDNFINDLEIYVNSYATLNYNSEFLYKQDGGGKIYSRGTVNFIKSNFEANQNSVVYNEGVINATNITSKPGDNNPSFFYNFGELNVTGNFQLNSNASFFNEGDVTVGGLTECTQGNKQIWWINKGHFTTKKFKIQAWNGTYYNFCNLIVLEDAFLHDGQFNIMDGGYTEAASADCNNFQVNMGANSGFNIKGNNSWGPQGDGTYQGFKATGANAYVRLGGTTTVAGHKNSLELTGNITYAINDLVDLGANDTGVQPTYVFNEGTIEAPFDKITATPNEEDCGATWIIDGEIPDIAIRIFAEDLSATTGSDFDFNDVVFDAEYISETQAKVTVWAAGGTLPLNICSVNGALYGDGFEVHDGFGVPVKCMVNTHALPEINAKGYSAKDNLPAYTKIITLPGNIGELLELSADEAKFDQNNFAYSVKNLIRLEVQKDGRWYELEAKKGAPACKIAGPVGKNATSTDLGIRWLLERKSIEAGYPLFTQYVGTGYPTNWWSQEVNELMYSKSSTPKGFTVTCNEAAPHDGSK